MKNEMFIKLLPIETERLIIRPTSIEDIDMILKIVTNIMTFGLWDINRRIQRYIKYKIKEVVSFNK